MVDLGQLLIYSAFLALILNLFFIRHVYVRDVLTISRLRVQGLGLIKLQLCKL